MSQNFWSALAAIGTVGAAIAAIVYVELTRRLWHETKMQREASLMLSLMTGYDELRDSIEYIQQYHYECASAGADPIDRFKAEKGVDYGTERAEALDAHRFRVSRFFVRTRKLVLGRYLGEKIVRDALGGQAIEDVFLKLVDPLDAAKAPYNYGSTDRAFYSGLLKKYPRPKSKTQVPPSSRSLRGEKL